MAVKERDEVKGASRRDSDEMAQTRTFFRAVPVFDRAQVTAGEKALPLEPPRAPLTGDSHAHLLNPLRAFAETLGYTVAFEEIPGEAGGWCDARRRRIVVGTDAPANAQVRILVHELAHALGVDYQRYSRHQAEVIVDTVTYIVTGSAGLDVAGETIPYIAGWGEDGALDAVNEFAATIDTIARQLETAITADEQAHAETERQAVAV